MKKSKEIRKYLKINENGNTTCQNSMGYSKSSSKREVYSGIDLPQETRKIQKTKKLTYHQKELEKEKNKVQSQHKEGNKG